MDVTIENYSGEKKLIAAIINKTIEDGRIHKYPSPPFISLKKHKEYIMKIKIIGEFLFKMINYKNITSFMMKLINFLIKLIVKLNRKRIAYHCETLAYEARQFFNHKNKLFSFYCTLIDIDPEYFAEKANKYFKDYDEGLIC